MRAKFLTTIALAAVICSASLTPAAAQRNASGGQKGPCETFIDMLASFCANPWNPPMTKSELDADAVLQQEIRADVLTRRVARNPDAQPDLQSGFTWAWMAWHLMVDQHMGSLPWLEQCARDIDAGTGDCPPWASADVRAYFAFYDQYQRIHAQDPTHDPTPSLEELATMFPGGMSELLCPPGAVCPVTIFDPNLPAINPRVGSSAGVRPTGFIFADGSIATARSGPGRGLLVAGLDLSAITVSGGPDQIQQEPDPLMSDTLSQDPLPCEIDPSQPRCGLPDVASMLDDIMGSLPAVTSEGTPLPRADALPDAPTSAPSRPLPSVALLPSGKWNPASDQSSGARLDPFTPLAIDTGQSPWQ